MAQQSLAEAQATLLTELEVGLGLGEPMSDQPAGVDVVAKPSAVRNKAIEQKAKASRARGRKMPDCELGLLRFFFMAAFTWIVFRQDPSATAAAKLTSVSETRWRPDVSISLNHSHRCLAPHFNE